MTRYYSETTSETTLSATTTFTVRKMTGPRISKLSTILLLCAALLLTKSCGILALSGDGSDQAVGQAEAWSETTTIQNEEGSGSTPFPEVDTTQPGDEVLTTEADEETTAPADQETTVADQEDATAGSGDAETTNAGDESSSSSAPETSTAAAETSSSEPETSTVAAETTSSEPETSTSVPETTTSSAAEETTTLAPPPPPFQCEAAGLFPIAGDCRRYHNCLKNPVLNHLQDIEITCPPLTAFSASLGRCVRDVAECPDDAFVCPAVGRFAGHDDSYYYFCVASLQGGLHKYLVRCSAGQRFETATGGCWRYDWTQIVPGQEATEISDLAAIKRELKLYKAEEKLRLKAQKQQEKLAKKQQKLEEKAAKKAAKEAAKEQAKAEKDKAKGQSIESTESEE
ncbi:hypothetical protein KR018_003488 [Drosophila ironensis]|nr:hypothetical protein KR018_003488 [Drosophila ironensis]